MKLILDRWQGLGDNLQVSTIPRRYFEKYGEKCVWVSDANKYNSEEVRSLVWESNPYIAGFTDEPGTNITHKLKYRQKSWIETWERAYDLLEPYNHRPELFVNLPSPQFNVSERVLIDISFSVSSYKKNICEYKTGDAMRKVLLDLYSQSPDPFITVTNNKILYNNNAFVNFLNDLVPEIKTETLEVNNILEYAQYLKACRRFICTHSGCHALGSAVGSETLCLIPKHYYDLRYFVFDNVQYISI